MRIISKILLVIAVSFAPFFSYAALNAGVVNGVWFSNPNPEEGEEVLMFTAVQNMSGETVSGTVAFLVNEKIVGSDTFTVFNNQVIPVSVPYIFEDGAHEVSAYITSSQDENVVYTISPETSVSVSPKINALPKDEVEVTKTSSASSTLALVTEAVTDTSKDTLAKVDPIAESVAQKVENFRDDFIKVEPDVENFQSVEGFEEEKIHEPPSTKKQAAKNFLSDSKLISKIEGLAIWKKAVGISLSFLSLLIRFWFILLTIFVLLFFWMLVRGRRIR